jgi:transposase-like protein
VAGHVERGGRVRATHLPHGQAKPLKTIVREYILPASMIYTDELESYAGLGAMGYQHQRINHLQRIYVEGDVHTNAIEDSFSLLKRGISGVYHSVSAKYLQRYLDEYAFRYNHRNDKRHLFKTMLARVENVPAGPPSSGLLGTLPE